MGDKVLQMNNIMKIYPNGVVAVEDVTLNWKKVKYMHCWAKTEQEKAP